MNDLSFFVAFAFYFVGLGLITYWVGYQTVRVIRVLQEVKASRQPAQVRVEAKDLQILTSTEDLPGHRQAVRK